MISPEEGNGCVHLPLTASTLELGAPAGSQGCPNGLR